ncbi:MAG: response regulator transcription factor [Alphaproteobacteria bacterium]
MTEDQPHILVVDDDKRLRELLRRFLAENGFRVTAAADAAEARAKIDNLAFDLIVLDLMMPGESGLSLTQSLRKTSTVPILMLTAMGETDHRIAGLESGADDYLAKPFEPRELVLRMRTILRRVPPPAAAPPPAISLGAYRFDLAREELSNGERIVRLSSGEQRLLRILAERPGTPHSREQLYEQMGSAARGRSIDVQITRLRRKIEPDPKAPRYLLTVRGQGYVLRPD